MKHPPQIIRLLALTYVRRPKSSRPCCKVVQSCRFLSIFARTLFVLIPSLAQHAPGSHARKQITIGDITISNFTASRAVQAEGFHITGPGTIANVPDSGSQSSLILHADEIDGTPDGKDAAGNLNLSGHISFTIDQSQKGVRRHISGTAGHVKMRRSEGQIRLTGAVHVNISDSSTLTGSAMVTAETAIIDLKAKPYSLVAEGSDQVSDIVFVPRRKTTGSGADRVHISQFSRGEFQPGVAAAFTGKQVRAEVSSTSSGNSVIFYSASIVSEFDLSVLTAIRSNVPVSYHAEQRLADGSVGQSADGSSQTAVLHIPDKVLLLSGASQTQLYNAAHLVGPGTLVSGLAKLDLGARPYQYTAEGPADTNSLQFTVRPAPDSKQSPISVHISGYLRMEHVTEQTVVFSGPYTTLDISQQNPRSVTHVLCMKLTVKMTAGNQSIERLSATDHVQYRVTSSIDSARDRLLAGTADTAVVAFSPPAKGAASHDSVKTITLHNVKCTLESPDALSGKATLRAGDVEQVTVDGQTRLTITGDAATTDLVAPMRAGIAPKDSTKPAETNALHLFRFQRAQLNEDGSMFESGPHAILEMLQTPARRASHVQADRIDVSVDKVTHSPLIATGQGRVMLSSGPTITQPVKGTAITFLRRLEASCEKASYNLPLKRIVLDGGVIGRITDANVLAEPCDIRADTVTIGLETPYSTLNLHDAGGADIQLTADIRMALLLKPAGSPPIPRTKPSQKPQAAPFLRLHLYRFHDAELEVGVSASASGAGTTLDADRSDGTKRMSLSSPKMLLRFSAGGQTLDMAEADGGVVFDAHSVVDSNVQAVHGTADNIKYLGELDQIRAAGHVEASFSDPQSLASPGTLRTESLTVDIGLPQYLYNCSGDPALNDIDFTTLQHETKPPAAASVVKRTAASPRPPVQLKVHAYSFNGAVLQPGSAVTLTGSAAHLDMMQTELVNTQKETDSQITAPHISASFSDAKETLSTARAHDGVQFAFSMPTASGLSRQSYSGFASSVDYTVAPTQADQRIDMMGHLSIKVVNPEEYTEPGLVEGLDGRALHMIIANGVAQYSWEGGSNPITMTLRPKQHPSKRASGGAESTGPNSSGKAPQ